MNTKAKGIVFKCLGYSLKWNGSFDGQLSDLLSHVSALSTELMVVVIVVVRSRWCEINVLESVSTRTD